MDASILFFSEVNKLRLAALFNRLPQAERGHGLRVGLYMQMLVADLLVTDNTFAAYCGEQASRLKHGLAREIGYYHDIGKAALPADLFNQKTPLSKQDETLMRSHALRANQLLRERLRPSNAREQQNLSLLLDAATAHHENWNGTGYPTGCAGDNIPYMGRVCAVADGYEHLQNDKASVSHRRALEQLESLSGTWYDPTVIAALRRCERPMKDLKRESLLDPYPALPGE